MHLVLWNENIAFIEKIDDGRKGSGFEIMDCNISRKFLIGKVCAGLEAYYKLDHFLPPSYHLHLFFGKVEADIIVDKLAFLIEFGKGTSQLFLYPRLSLHIFIRYQLKSFKVQVYVSYFIC